MVDVSLLEVAGALALVAVAIGIAVWERTGLERDVGLATVRAFVQLTAIGYVIQLIFDSDELVFVVALLAVMVTIGAFTARTRAREVPGALGTLFVALGLAAAATLVLVIALGVFPATPRYLVPVGGMVIGNAMTAAAVALNRLGEDVRSSTREIEAALALGATGGQAIRAVTRRSLRSATIPVIDQTKTTGLITFPGTMVGMLVAGAQPVDAVRLQLILLYLLMGAVAIAALTAVALARRRFFTAAQQLREPAAPAR